MVATKLCDWTVVFCIQEACLFGTECNTREPTWADTSQRQSVRAVRHSSLRAFELKFKVERFYIIVLPHVMTVFKSFYHNSYMKLSLLLCYPQFELHFFFFFSINCISQNFSRGFTWLFLFLTLAVKAQSDTCRCCNGIVSAATSRLCCE